MRSVFLVLFIALGLTLQACGSVNPITAARLALMSPLEADPAGFEVTIRLPDGVSIPKGATKLTMEAANANTGETLSGAFVLAETGDQTRSYRIAAEDLDAMRAFQAKARAREETDSDASTGSIGISLEFCRLADGPAPDATSDVFIRLAEGGAMLPLLTNAPITEAATEQEIAALAPC